MPHFSVYDPLWYCAIIKKKEFIQPQKLSKDSHETYRRCHRYTDQFGYFPGSQKEFLISRAKYQMNLIATYCGEVLYYWHQNFYSWDGNVTNENPTNKLTFNFFQKQKKSFIPFEREIYVEDPMSLMMDRVERMEYNYQDKYLHPNFGIPVQEIITIDNIKSESGNVSPNDDLWATYVNKRQLSPSPTPFNDNYLNVNHPPLSHTNSFNSQHSQHSHHSQQSYYSHHSQHSQQSFYSQYSIPFQHSTSYNSLYSNIVEKNPSRNEFSKNSKKKRRGCCDCLPILKWRSKQRTILTDLDDGRLDIHKVMKRAIRIRDLDPILMLVALFLLSVFIKVYKDSKIRSDLIKEYSQSVEEMKSQLESIIKVFEESQTPNEIESTPKESEKLEGSVFKKNGLVLVNIAQIPEWCSLKIFYFVSLLLAFKLYDPDLPKDNITFFQSFHLQKYISLDQFNSAEIFMTKILDYNISVGTDEFIQFLMGYSDIAYDFIQDTVIEPDTALSSTSVQELNDL